MVNVRLYINGIIWTSEVWTSHINIVYIQYTLLTVIITEFCRKLKLLRLDTVACTTLWCDYILFENMFFFFNTIFLEQKLNFLYVINNNKKNYCVSRYKFILFIELVLFYWLGEKYWIRVSFFSHCKRINESIFIKFVTNNVLNYYAFI